MSTHSRILAWRIPWTKEPGGLQSTDNKESDMTEHAPPPPPPRAYEHKVDFHLHMHIWETLKSLKSALEGWQFFSSEPMQDSGLRNSALFFFFELLSSDFYIKLILQALLSLGFSWQEHWSGLPFPSPMQEVKSESEVTQSCPTLCDLMDCSLSGFSVHGIFQARVLEWGAIAFS